MHTDPSSSGPDIIYNVTIMVDHAIANSWLQWLLEEHIPDVLSTGCFTGHQVLRLLEVDEAEGLTYAIQYKAPSREEYYRYIKEHASEMRDRSVQKWGDRFIAFRTVMEVVQ